MKAIKLFLTAAIFLFSLSAARAEVFVLCYHSFLGKPRVQYDFNLQELRAQLRQLKESGFRFVTYDDVLKGRVTGSRNIMVTIDDGNRSVYRAYWDVFRPMGIKPMLSIYPFIIGKKEYVLTWKQLKELSDDGCEIASHGYFHLKVNRDLYQKKPRDFRQEIYKSKKTLEEKLGKNVTVFIYPFGLWSDITIQTLREAGYHHAFTIINGPVKTPISLNREPYQLKRYMLTRPLSKSTIRHIVQRAEKLENRIGRSRDDSDARTGMNLLKTKESTPPATGSDPGEAVKPALSKGETADSPLPGEGVFKKMWNQLSLETVRSYETLIRLHRQRADEYYQAVMAKKRKRHRSR